jgi:hypothetical protein
MSGGEVPVFSDRHRGTRRLIGVGAADPETFDASRYVTAGGVIEVPPRSSVA